MIFIILCILSVIFLFFITVTLLRMRETWIYETKDKPLNQKFRNIQAAFRKLVSSLEVDDIVNVTTKQRLTTIATNFFVFQPINEHNIARLLLTFESCRVVFEQCLDANSRYPEEFPEIFEQLVETIPISARDFDADFYNSVLPRAFEKFRSSIQKLSRKSFFEDEDEDKEFEVFTEQARKEKQKQLLEKNIQSPKENDSQGLDEY